MSADLPFTGLRVVELASVIAGPMAGMIFADLGADVIKVERAGTGDDARSMPPFADGVSTLYLSVNRNKRGVELDLKEPGDRERYLRLIEDADVVIESFRPGAADRLGVGYPEVAERNPRIIYSQISGFGRTPAGDGLAGYDPLVQASSGLMSMTGEPGGTPVRTAASVVDITTGMWAAMSIMAELSRTASRTRPVLLESTLFDSGVMLLFHQVASMLATGDVPTASGSASPIAAPYEAFQASDGWIMLGAGNDRAYQRLCAVLGATALATEPRFQRTADRVAHRDELHEKLARFIEKHTAGHWLDVCRTASLPIERVNRLDEALGQPLIDEREMLIESLGDGGIPTVRLPILPQMPAARRAPTLGEHSEDVFKAHANPWRTESPWRPTVANDTRRRRHETG